MKALIRNATIICKSSPFHKTIQDLFIADGIIQQIGVSLTAEADIEINQHHLHVSIGWMDVFAHFCEPGMEHRETLHSGSVAAAAGGFTHVMIMPGTQPVIDSKSQLRFIIERSKQLPVTILPIASCSKNAEGKELSEMYDLYECGAVAFSNGIKGLQDPGITLKTLQYLKAVNSILIQVPSFQSINPGALMNEGIVSTQLGLPGKPSMAEELMVHRDIELAAYTNSSLHITGISTARSVELIRQAKENGIKVTCSVTPYHLLFSDDDLMNYDTNLKVDPPLRTKNDVTALREGIKNGIIDCIASHHLPQHADDKECEFEYAKNGMITLQNIFGIVSQILPLEKAIELLTILPRNIFNLPVPQLSEGAPASLTMFVPEETYIFDRSMIRSLSANSPFIGRKMKGKVIGTLHNNLINLATNE